MKFTPDQLTEYNERGYVIIDSPFPGALTDACLQAIEKVAEEPTLDEDGKKNHHRLRPQLPDSYWCKLDHSLPFLQIELHSEIVELARQLENEDDIYFRNAGINELAPQRSFLWHRDTDLEYIEFMHYFSGSSKKNGCLRVIPGSHIGSVDHLIAQVEEQRQKRGDTNPTTGQSIPDVELPGEISLELHRDQLRVRSSRIYHATWANVTSESRLMHHWIFRKHPTPNHRFTFRDYLTPELLDHLTPAQHKVLYLDRKFEIDPKYHKERERELGKIFRSIV